MITFQYFDGCPNSVATQENLIAVIGELGISESNVEIVEVSDLDSAEKMNFQGSPSILIDGADIYTGIIPTSFQYTCRVYQFDGEQTGIMPKEYLREKLTDHSA